MQTAKTRKRCPQCSRMIEVGEAVTVTDDRRQATSGATPWIGNRQSYTRGAVHLWHPACRVERVRLEAELAERSKAEFDARQAELAAAIKEARGA